MVMFGLELQLEAITGSMDLLQPGSVLMSMALAANNGHADFRGLD